MLALSSLEDWHVQGLDIQNAFLYGKLDEEIYMEQPEGFKVKGQENKVLHLCCALYGLKQTALAWWKELAKSMKELGFKSLSSDANVFVYKTDRELIIAVVYVDDAMFLGTSYKFVIKKKQEFMDKWKCHDLGETKEFLCMCIK
jgi:Reverse transcriptase (RNA-dependent DNA polymerase)